MTPDEREQRIQAAAEARYEDVHHGQRWEEGADWTRTQWPTLADPVEYAQCALEVLGKRTPVNFNTHDAICLLAHGLAALARRETSK